MFRPTASLQRLRQRAALLAKLRAFFARQGLWEVETPILSADTVVDRYLDPIPVSSPCCASGEDDLPRTYWLQTSPEFGMKRLLAAGADHIYQIARVFRRDELGPWHNPEFTMVEWYCVGDDLQQGMQRLGALCCEMLGGAVPPCLTYRDAFGSVFGIDPHLATLTELASVARQAGVAIPTSFDAVDRDEWLNLLLAECVQPTLGQAGPVILCDYPASQAALARLREDDHGQVVAARFELYVQGIELANGYHELLDADQLRSRQTLANVQRQADGRVVLPEQNRLLAAMEAGLPDCCGVALGFDRLVMVALQAQELSEVIAFPFDRA